jgi:23S rRNA (pseudouridine1915-N3)-methyltransferase
LRITILAIGKNREADLDRLIRTYQKRCPWPILIHELVPRRGESEADRLARALALVVGDVVVALDEAGDLATSAALAERLGGWRDAGRNVTFLIGGADGLAAGLTAAADWRLALGRLTWPHLLVRLLLMEQLYRAGTILAGHPYHR